jgi:cyclase
MTHMLRTRVIPCLLLRGNGFYKTTKFKNPVYLGDPINILKIFNDKEVDEIFVLDIGATSMQKDINMSLLRDFASECFMPVGYGGGIKTIDQMRAIFQLGFEKVAVNTAAFENPNLITKGAKTFGSQSIVVSIDVKRSLLGSYEVMTRSGNHKTGRHPVDYAMEMEARGAGEFLINAIDRDGTMEGYDLKLIRSVAAAVKIPVIAIGGAGNVRHLGAVVKEAGASAAAAGAMFVFQGPHRAVLINVPTPKELESIFAT